MTTNRTRRRQKPPLRGTTGAVEVRKVDPRILAAARAALRPGERLVIVDTETVRLVPDR